METESTATTDTASMRDEHDIISADNTALNLNRQVDIKSIYEVNSSHSLTTNVLEQVEERQKSITPIFRLPFDVLSEIFIVCSLQRRLSSIIMASVCRRWREVVLSTPLAWSRIYPQNAYDYILPPQYLSMFFKRSNPCPLHIRVSWSPVDCECRGYLQMAVSNCDCANVRLTLENAHRLQCLVIRHEWLDQLSERDYPNLERLTFPRRDGDVTIKTPQTSLDLSRFSSLTCLELGRLWQLNSVINLTNQGSPRLKYLYLGVDRNGIWVNLVKAFSDTLESLRIYGDYGRSTTNKWTFDCPQLDILIVAEGHQPGTAGSCTLEVHAPKLTTFEYYSIEEIIYVAPKGGVERIAHLTTNTVLPLSDYPHIRTVQFDFDHSWLPRVLKQLEDNIHLCPKLVMIELRDTVGSDFELAVQERLANRNRTAGSSIKLKFVSEWLSPTRRYDYKASVLQKTQVLTVYLRNTCIV